MAKEDFGDFKEIKEQKEQKEEPKIPSRVRTPRNNELIGIIREGLGGNRMNVQTTDGKTRNCRVPGKYKRRLWLRPRDVVMIIPWEDNDDKGDIIYKYPPAAVSQLKKQGVLDSIKDEF